MHNNHDQTRLRKLLTAPQAFVTLDARLPDRGFVESLPPALHVAADGAALRLLALGITPDLVVGDLDSIGDDHGIAPERLIRIEDQDANDFEKCLRHCLSRDLTRIMVFGLHGGELEHTLNNWSVFMRFAQRADLCLYDAGRFGIPVFKELILPARRDEMISFIPQPAAVITSSGVEWPLTNEVLSLGVREGARNRATERIVSLSVHEGAVLTFCDAHYDRFSAAQEPTD